jgi:hypothetical protein
VSSSGLASPSSSHQPALAGRAPGNLNPHGANGVIGQVKRSIIMEMLHAFHVLASDERCIPGSRSATQHGVGAIIHYLRVYKTFCDEVLHAHPDVPAVIRIACRVVSCSSRTLGMRLPPMQ